MINLMVRIYYFSTLTGKVSPLYKGRAAGSPRDGKASHRGEEAVEAGWGNW